MANLESEYGSDVETSVDEDGNIIAIVPKTDKAGEKVTDVSGEVVTKAETVTTADGEKVKETTTAKKEDTTKKETETTKKPTEAATTKATEAATQKPTQAPKPTEAPTQKPTEKATQAPTQAPTQAQSNKPKPASNWTVTTVTKMYDDEPYTFKMYTDGTWVFDFMGVGNSLDTEANNPYVYDGGIVNKHYKASGLWVLDYLGSATDVKVPSSIDGYPVRVMCCTFEDESKVTKVTIPNSVIGVPDAFYNSTSVKDIVIEAGSTMDKYIPYNGTFMTRLPNHAHPNIYCEKNIYEWADSWGCIINNANVYSLDGKTTYKFIA